MPDQVGTAKGWGHTPVLSRAPETMKTLHRHLDRFAPVATTPERVLGSRRRRGTVQVVTQAAPPTRFLLREGGRRLAYTVHGSGPVLVCPAWWVSHLESDWKRPGFRDLFGGLASHLTVVRYDRPGSGLSDRERERVDLAGEVATLSALVDHLQLERFALFAVSCAGPPALAYAAENPARVSHLIFFGSFLRGADVGPRAIKDAIQSLVVAHWGIGSKTIANLFAPNLAAEQVKQMSRDQRDAASPHMAARLLDLTFDVDVSDTVPSIRAPALVLHRTGDRTIRAAAGRELAARLPGAQLTLLDGDEHVPWLGDVAPVRNAVLEFVGADPDRAARRALPTDDNALHRSGDVWTLTFAGRSVHMRHARGLIDLAVLLTRPGTEVHVAELWSGATSAEALGSGADPVVDDQALDAYRRRLRQLVDDIGEAEARGDADRAERLQSERDALGRELRAAVGLGGRKRGLGQPSERARKAVSARIHASIKKIGEVHPELGRHLETSVRTGNYCSYDPQVALEWAFSESGTR